MDILRPDTPSIRPVEIDISKGKTKEIADAAVQKPSALPTEHERELMRWEDDGGPTID